MRSGMDSNLIVLGLGRDPRIFRGTNGEASREPAAEGRPILTYKPESSNDFDPFGLFEFLDLLDSFSFLF